MQVQSKPANIPFSPPPGTMNKQYESKDIEVLEGLEPVKRRPGMYSIPKLSREYVDGGCGHVRCAL